LRDIDNGFWRFCTGYNDAHPILPPTNDPVVAHFLSLDLFPWTEVEARTWARVGHADPREKLSVTVEVLTMPWATRLVPVAGKSGAFYDVVILARGSRHMDYQRLLRMAKAMQGRIAHLCLSANSGGVRVTVPTVIGENEAISVIGAFCEAARNCLLPGDGPGEASVNALADAQPEFVLGPRNPLTFLGPDMPCAFFQGLDEAR